MRKDSEDQEIIIAFLKNGGRLYYDESENDWSDNKADASRYSHQDARKKWAELTKGGRKLPDQRFRNLFCVVDKKTQDDIVKTPKGWANKGREGTHGHFSTKKAAREQQKAMFANGYKGDSGNYSEDEEFVNDSISRVWEAAFEKIYHRDGSKTDYRDVVREMLRIQPELTKRELLRWNADTSTTPNYSGDDDLEIEAAIHDVFRGKSESKDNRSQEYIVEAKSAKDALDKVKKMRDMSRHTPVSNYPRHAIPAHYVSAKVVQPKTDFHNDMSSDKFRNDLYNAQKANNIDIFKGDIAEIIEDCKADRNMSRSWGAHYKKYKNVLINFNAIPGIFSAAVTKGINDFIALGI